MNVASLELCKELYELSGWDATDFWHCTFRNESSPKEQWMNVYNTVESIDEAVDMEERTYLKDYKRRPAYDLGYLLRRLPKVGKTGVYAWTSLSDHKRTPTHQEYYAVWECEDGNYYDFYADTPENAAAKLAIELFKQGILTKDGAV